MCLWSGQVEHRGASGGTSEGAPRARVWGGAVCEGRAWRGVDGFLTSLWSPGPAEGLNPGVGGLPAWEFEKL